MTHVIQRMSCRACAAVGTITLALAAHAQAGPPDTLSKLRETGVVTLGVREASGSLSYTVGEGKYVGFHVDVCQRIVANIEKELGRKLESKYQNVTSQNRVPLVQNGTVDLECGSTTNTVARAQQVSFAYTTFVEEVRTAVKANSGISTVSQLAGRTVATSAGTTSVQHLRRLRSNGVDFREVLGKDHADSFLMLQSGRADAFVLDSGILAAAIASSDRPSDYRIIGHPLSVEPVAIMLRKDDRGIKKIADDTIRAMVQSGEMARLWDKWFIQPVPPNNKAVGLPLSDSTRSAWENLSDRPMEEWVGKR